MQKLKKKVSEQRNAFFERFDTNFDAKFERDERFDEIDEKIRFDVENDEIIEWEDVKDEIFDRIIIVCWNFDVMTKFDISNKKTIECEESKRRRSKR